MISVNIHWCSLIKSLYVARLYSCTIICSYHSIDIHRALTLVEAPLCTPRILEMEDVPTPYARHRQLTRLSCMPQARVFVSRGDVHECIVRRWSIHLNSLLVASNFRSRRSLARKFVRPARYEYSYGHRMHCTLAMPRVFTLRTWGRLPDGGIPIFGSEDFACGY